MQQLNRKFKLEVLLASSSTAVGAMTAIWRDWIEFVFRIDPDRGSGAIEWMLVVLMATAAVGCAVLARAEWRSMRATERSAAWSLHVHSG